jgi:8-oxo-dGTP pyrophosphatase MutT (NUDIX family)
MRRGTGGVDEVLILRRSPRVGTYRGRWAGVSGYLETDDPLEQAYTELSEETGLTRDDVRLLSAGEPVTVVDADAGRRWTVYPFLFLAVHPERIATDWEHVAARWVRPDALPEYETVPGLAAALAAVYPPRAPAGGAPGASRR